MAILIFEHRGNRQAGTLKGRVLIGRWPDLTVVIDDRAVSRIHAWVGVSDGRYYIADAGSRTGTFVNGEPLQKRHILADGDQIRIGPAVLKYRVDPAPPVDIEPIDLTPHLPSELSTGPGVFMDCVCGAPLWLPRQFAGVGQCRFCGHTVTQNMDSAANNRPAATPPPARAARLASAPVQAVTPPPSLQAAPLPEPHDAPPGSVAANRIPRHSAGPAIPPAAPALQPLDSSYDEKTNGERICGVCHCPITLFDEVQACPSCGMSFHADCWQENRGCSAYGCAYVGALNGKESPA
jgi:hypothetical protein